LVFYKIKTKKDETFYVEKQINKCFFCHYC